MKELENRLDNYNKLLDKLNALYNEAKTLDHENDNGVLGNVISSLAEACDDLEEHTNELGEIIYGEIK